MQNKLQTRGLIQIISQLPDNSIIKINNQSIRNDYVFNLIKDNLKKCRHIRLIAFGNIKDGIFKLYIK